MSIRRREFLAGLGAVGGASLFRPVTAAAQQTAAQQPYPRPDLRERALPRRFTYSQPVIDAHTHFYAKEFVDLAVAEGAANGAEITGPSENGAYRLRAWGAGYYPYEGSLFDPADPKMDLEAAVRGMEERGGVNMHVLQMTHPKVYWAPPEFGLRLSQAQNNGLSAAHVKYPDRFLGSIMLPLQNPNLALQELERAAKLPGMRGINVAQHINGTNVADKRFWPVWARCEELGQPLILHNLDPLATDRLHQGGLNLMNSLGNPFEATLAPMSLILSGTLDEFPNLDVYLPHAGGAFPWLVWRTDYVMSHGGFPGLRQPRASDYLRRFHYDLILHSPKLMRTLIDMVGADRITCGTDWPQGMSIWRPVEYVESIPGITQREAEQILCENPARLLRL
jgi:aminocarboxymuconate-semialdehyde decarboxylase